MSDLKQITSQVSVEEYLDREAHAAVRHEYVGGDVYQMVDITLDHNRISGNILSLLDNALEDTESRPFMSGVKVRVRNECSEFYYYPDVVVTCDPRDDGPYWVERPTTIFEVLSDASERFDRVEKFRAYRSLSSLQDYVLVSQKEKRITVARRENDWQAEVFIGDEFALAVACCEVLLESARIYRNVDFSV